MPITLEKVEFTYMAKTPYERKALQGVSLTVDKLSLITHLTLPTIA